ncbi:MAG: hypothetical protein BRD39_04595 [Bacteroidetes bacterium QH_9_64_21]|nr:MAG: hypothetical protein BRD39_04595 [Bacteroidetes bacterium QH_9_64_21]
MSAAASFVLRPLAPTDADVAKQLWTARLALGLVAVAPQTDEIVGVSFLDVGRRAYTRQYLGLDALDLAPSLADRNGIFHLSCVRADWEAQGIGAAFYERRLEALAGRDVPRAFGIAWHRPAPVDSRVLFETFDFTCLATIERYYSRTGTRPTCPACSGACQCTASLYGRTVHQP